MKQLRQRGALERLEAQLESGVKTQKGTIDEKVPLTEKDVKRIKKDIEVLKKRLK